MTDFGPVFGDGVQRKGAVPLPLHRYLQFQGELAAVPAEGKVLEYFRDGNSVLGRGIFPIHDAAGNTVSAMFVVRDISPMYVAMRHTQNVLIVIIVLSLTLGIFLVLTLLNRLIFRRLNHIIKVATRVVGSELPIRDPGKFRR